MIPDDELPLKDRAYILRFRPDGASEDEFIPVVTFTITTYQCGLRAGDGVILKADEGVYRAGDRFVVLTGAEEDPSCLWMLDPDRKTCGWDDDFSIYELFEKLEK